MKKKLSSIVLWLVFLISCATMKSATYGETVAHWTSYQKVPNGLFFLTLGNCGLTVC